MPSQEAVRTAEMLRAGRPSPDMPLDAQRAAFDALGSLLPLAEGVEVVRTDAGGVPAEWLVADPDGPVVLHLHAGGFAIGSCESHRPFASHLAARVGGRVLVPEYRLAPEHPYPAANDDAEAVHRWLVGEGIDPAALRLTGDSAGGALAVSLLGRLRRAGTALPRAVALVSPFTDFTQSGASLDTKAEVDPMLSREIGALWNGWYLAGADPTDPDLSPLHADLSGLPPMLILVGSEEVLLDDATRLAERARAAGVEVTLEVWEGLFHIWTAFAPLVPEALDGIDRLARFLVGSDPRP
jgi:acetyl esterase/lipase